MRKVWKYLILFFLIAGTLALIKLNLNLYAESTKKSEIQSDIILQLNFLENGLKNNNLGDEMQKLFPEGFVFVNALYALSWCELAASAPNNLTLQNKAKQEAIYAYTELNSSKAFQSFDQSLLPKYGVFYFGWNNYLLSKLLFLDSNRDESNVLVKQYKNQCDSFVKILTQTNKTYLESYALQSWPADMFVAMASLSNHDKLFKPKYTAIIDEWLKEVTLHLDKKTQLIPHKVDSENARTLDGARGCSMALILRMMHEIDHEIAHKYYKTFKKLFVTTTFGLPSLREYPSGRSGLGDIDSGPVIFGVGFSGTIVMIGTLALFDSNGLWQKQYETINAFGLKQIKNNHKHYLLGKLPMADAFIAWGRSSALHYNSTEPDLNSIWAIKFHLYSFLCILLLWILVFLKKLINWVKRMNNTKI